MGHIRLGPLPKTRKWVRVVGLIANGAAAAQVAAATVTAAEKALLRAANDPGVVESVWLLAQLPLAAAADEFGPALRDRGLVVPDEPTLLTVIGAASEAVDAKLAGNRGRTDLGEMAQAAAAESLAAVVGGRLRGLFDPAPDEVRAAFARLGAEKQFGHLARDFFARFTFKALNYFVGKAAPGEVGEAGRFRTLAQLAAFIDSLDTHCREAAGVVERFAGGWYSKARFETGGEVPRDRVAGFVAHAMTKLTDELRARA
ncbi:MAG: hypothetical protein K2X82_17670 [Gemmataceae bacterium]|nr:hypothetical protein [Gemmataceae bacterium]